MSNRNSHERPRRAAHSFFFFGGLSIHLSQALLAHLFSYNITWGATKKEVERSNFFIEVPRILRRFWLAFVISLLMFVMIIVFSTDLVPSGWQIPGIDWAVIFPLASSSLGAIFYSPDRTQSLVDDLLILISLSSHTASPKTGGLAFPGFFKNIIVLQS